MQANAIRTDDDHDHSAVRRRTMRASVPLFDVILAMVRGGGVSL
jgi:hypothetical protein